MILILLGRSGCGKTVIMKRLVDYHGYVQVRTCTTRDRREGEPEEAYYFMSEDEFREHLKNDDFVEMDKYGDNLYGTLKSSLEGNEKYVAVLTPEGAEAVKKAFPEAFIVHIVTDMKTSVLRAINREKELDPGKLHTITVRACQDYYLYDKPVCDREFPNPDGIYIWELVKEIENAHLSYELKSALKETTDVLRECVNDLKEYNEKKAAKHPLPITFRLYQSIRFNRPVDKEKDHISPGGYEVTMQCEDGTEKTIQFDFEDSEGGVSDEDSCVVEMMQKNPDWGSFEELKSVTEYMLRHITAVKEWYVYTGEPGEQENPLIPIEIIEPELELISDGNGNGFDPKNSRIPITVPIPLE